MMDALWTAGLLFANLWAAGSLGNLGDELFGGAFDNQPPVPVQPWIAERVEENPGRRIVPPTFDEAPSIPEILRAMPKRTSIPGIYEEWRDDIEIVSEKLVDRTEPERFYPLIGQARLRHCHWKCTVRFTETTNVVYPFPAQTQCKRTEVVYIDKDHFVLAKDSNSEPANPQPQKVTRPVGAPDILQIDTNRLQPKQPGADGAFQQIRGEHLIRPDGTISLGTFGSVHIGGMTLPQVKVTVERHLEPYFVEPKVAVDVRPYKSETVAGSPIAPAGEKKALRVLIEDYLYDLGVLSLNRNPGDPMVRMEQMLIDSENLRQMHEEWRQFWMKDQPTQLIPSRIHGGVEESAEPPRNRQMSLSDIVRLSKRRISEDIILRQIENTGSVFTLSVDDILSLNEQGVSDNVIRAMQSRR